MLSPSNSDKFSDSEISDSYINSKSAIRVSICLKHYFKDFRSLCYILVNGNRPVRWLERRLQKIFALHGNFCLCTNGHLLPSTEPLALLRPDDSIEVIPILEVEAVVNHTTGMLNSNMKTPLGNENEDNANNLFDQQCAANSPASVTKFSETTSEEAYTSKRGEMLEQNSSMSNFKLKSRDQVDSAGVSESQSAATSDLTINNNMKEMKSSNELKEFKQQALFMLDKYDRSREVNEINSEYSIPAKRTRRRVRRRTRRIAGSEQTDAHDTRGQESEGREFKHKSSPVSPPAASMSPDAPALPASDVTGADVARNEAASSRKPRLVRPLEIQTSN